MNQNCTDIVRDEDLQPDERAWLFGSYESRESTEKEFKTIHQGIKIALLAMLRLSALLGGNIDNRPDNSELQPITNSTSH